MPNMSNNELTRPEQRFIEDVAQLFVPWGVPPTAARLYGYLLLSEEPASLDRIAAVLKVSKSSASVAAKLLERYTLARRRPVPGSKRILYEVSDSYEEMLAGETRMLRDLGALLAGAKPIARSDATRDRLEEMAEFYALVREAISVVQQRWRERRHGPR
ncbi:GbsR/MarR family transcriptional regulator [Pelagibacterium halotolerans]|uniref:GbsR/MarR family transcriptional regulator n=1 Tax=Pelagibacterium halotolerans TaxID=531813 RepID=UPI00384BAFDE